jgi:hypothetical protein
VSIITYTRSFPCTPILHRSRMSDARRLLQQRTLVAPSTTSLMFLGPHVGAQYPCTCPLSYKRGGMQRYKGDTPTDRLRLLALKLPQQSNTQWSRVLRSGGPNHSKSSRVLVFRHRLAGQAKRLSPFLILGLRAGALCHPAGEFPLRHLARQVGGQGIRFLLVFSLSMMVQIVEHRAETSTDFLVEEEAVSSTPQVPNRPMSRTAAVHAAWQHTTAQTSRTPSRTAPGALSVARELLRHPPSSTASPGAMKQ